MAWTPETVKAPGRVTITTSQLFSTQRCITVELSQFQKQNSKRNVVVCYKQSIVNNKLLILLWKFEFIMRTPTAAGWCTTRII